ncbi:hypothetical protein WJX73_001329 [Symbiochloris irregularis]|uniref:Phosphoacetylglucosamine mutase n=1 Tax=Symbiochloris irregularis TaxID=706552 RepID=A0AAW1P7V8_9CHLO
MALDVGKLLAGSVQYPKLPEVSPSYGTAGFRSTAVLLPCTVFRCGVLMALRAMHTGAATGIVITASHNPEQDNGVKLVEPSGHMLSPSWEAFADRLANAPDDDALAELCHELISQHSISIGNATVMVAHDSRPSAVALVAAAGDGISCVGATAYACGLLTTPQLHWMVMKCNRKLPHSKEDYFHTLAEAYEQLTAGAATPDEVIIVDCANGVGANALQQLQEKLGAKLRLKLFNTEVGVAGKLNADCGADFVQKERTGPASMTLAECSGRCASIDGDADRLVFFSQEGDTLALLDGDKIAALLALLVQQLLKAAGLEDVSLGVVQTAYANGASTQFLQQLPHCTVQCTPTGVKHLHAAAEKFDIGIYFEANGHGTVLIGKPFLEKLQKTSQAGGEKLQEAARQLEALATLSNQAVGDALSGLLMVEAALQLLQKDLQSWGALYRDLPSRQRKVSVRDRSVVKTADAERKAVSPAGLQEGLDKAAASVKSGRVFVRPSGTEDVVRVYAEAATQEDADGLALEAARLLHHLAGGTGAEV